jgi:hypothetical protein
MRTRVPQTAKALVATWTPQAAAVSAGLSRVKFDHLALASVSSEMRAEARWEIVDAAADEFEQLM